MSSFKYTLPDRQHSRRHGSKHAHDIRHAAQVWELALDPEAGEARADVRVEERGVVVHGEVRPVRVGGLSGYPGLRRVAAVVRARVGEPRRYLAEPPAVARRGGIGRERELVGQRKVPGTRAVSALYAPGRSARTQR